MIGFTLILLAAAAAYGLAWLTRLPSLPLLLIAGMLLAPLGIVPDERILFDTLELGLAFLVFVAGVELNPRRIGHRTRPVIWIGVVQFFTIGALGFGLALALGHGWQTALFIAFALSASSTLVVLRHLKRHQQMFEPFGRVVTGVLLLQDLFMILIIVGLARIGDTVLDLGLGLAMTLGLAVAAFALLRWVIPVFLKRLHPGEEELLLAVLSLLFIFMGLAHFLELPLIAGAFFAGFALSGFPMSGLVRGLLNSLADFFLALFFTVLGVLIVLPPPELLFQTGVFILFLILVSPPLVAVVAEATGMSSRASIESGLLLAQTSEFSLIVGLSGMVAGIITPEVFSMIALITVGTMTLTPLIATDRVTWRLMRIHPLRWRRRQEENFRDHALMLGYGTAGPRIIKPLLDAGMRVLVVDDDPNVIARLRRAGISCLRGDGSDYRTLELAHAREARLILSSMRRPTDAEGLLRHLGPERAQRAVIRAFEPEGARRIEAMGGRVIATPEITAEEVLRWIETLGPSARTNGSE